MLHILCNRTVIRCQSIALAMHALTIMLLMITTQETPLFLLFLQTDEPAAAGKGKKGGKDEGKAKGKKK